MVARNQFIPIVRSSLFNIALYGVTVVMCFIMLWALFLPRRLMLDVVHLWLRQVAWIERHIAGLDYQILGHENIPEGACIIAAKHQSAWETFKLHLIFGDPAIVLKKELLQIPLWGWYLRKSGMIPIDRAAGGKAVSSMMVAAHHAAEAGRKIVIFPQGTRTGVGEKRAYKNGVTALYQELKLPIVPMALNSGLFWPKHRFVKRQGRVTISFLPPIPVGLSREQVMERLKRELETESERLVHS